MWISYVFLKCPNAHAAVQRIDLSEAADPCGKLERLAHVANFVFRKGFLPANVRSRVHWEDACKRHIEEHVCVKDVLCERDVGKNEDKPLRLVIGWNSALVTESVKPVADFGFKFKTIHPVFVDKPSTGAENQIRAVLLEPADEPALDPVPLTASQPFHTSPITTPVFLIPVDSVPSLWTIHTILFGIILLLSWTTVLYLWIYPCARQHCPIQ